MLVGYSKWTYEEEGRPMEGRTNGHGISQVIPDKAIAEGYPTYYDTQTQLRLVLDEAAQPTLCADVFHHTGAYWIDANGVLQHDATWEDDMP